MNIIVRYNLQRNVKVNPMYGEATNYSNESALDSYILCKHKLKQESNQHVEQDLELLLNINLKKILQDLLEQLNSQKELAIEPLIE